MNDPKTDQKLLAEATVQEIQLELIRRTSYNSLDGKRVVASLDRHRDLCTAVLLDRATYSTNGGLPSLGLIKLRDLPGNFWNADTLFILCKTAEKARKLGSIIEDERWSADVVRVHEDQRAAMGALGTSEGGYVVTVWWD